MSALGRRRAIAGATAVIAALLVSGCGIGPSYNPRSGPRVEKAEQARFHYDNDLPYVCDEPRFAIPARREGRHLERLLSVQPGLLLRMEVASSDEPGDLDRDVTVREFVRLNLRSLRAQIARGRHRSGCLRRYSERLSRALARAR